jgi:hypothetical protein
MVLANISLIPKRIGKNLNHLMTFGVRNKIPPVAMKDN